MGTRADFYVGRGEKAEWLGSVAWDGYPGGINSRGVADKDGKESPVLTAKTEAEYRAALSLYFEGRKDVTLPEMGWPWPWKDSGTTDYAYAFDGDQVWGTSFAHGWWKATEEPDGDADRDSHPGKVAFPDMTKRMRATLGDRSGLIVL